jgi:hypothetical protein
VRGIASSFIVLFTAAACTSSTAPAERSETQLPCRLEGAIDTGSLKSYYCISIGVPAKWERGEVLQIAPTDPVTGRLDVPRDLADAWRTLDAILPRNFVAVVAPPLAQDCRRASRVLDPDLFDLHAQLWHFLHDKWLDPEEPTLLKALGKIVGLKEVELLSGDVQSLLAGKVLCRYYSVSQGRVFSDAEWISDVRREVKRGSTSRYRSPYSE